MYKYLKPISLHNFIIANNFVLLNIKIIELNKSIEWHYNWYIFIYLFFITNVHRIYYQHHCRSTPNYQQYIIILFGEQL